MTVALELVGLREERMLRSWTEQEGLVDDVMGGGPVEFAAAPLVSGSRRGFEKPETTVSGLVVPAPDESALPG